MGHTYRDDLLKGKVAFVAGGTSGINLRVAQVFAEFGASVAVMSRKPEKVEAAVASIRQVGGAAFGGAADVRDYEATAGVIAAAAAELGKFDIVLSGAAGNFPAPALGMSSNAFKAVLDIDTLGTYNVLRAAFEHMNTPGATVINISAPQSIIPYALQSHVCAAKAGVDMLTRCLAVEWGPLGVRVNAIIPGPIAETEGMDRLAPTPEAKKAAGDRVPLKRMGQKDDVANMALFLASDAASYVTGAILNCDGGMTLMGASALGQ